MGRTGQAAWPRHAPVDSARPDSVQRRLEMRLEIGNRVSCTDGAYGELADIVVDPLEKHVTHLVIRP